MTLRGTQSGFSIVAVLVAMAMVGALAVALSTMQTNSARATKSNELRDELISLRRTLRSKTDCGQTLTSVTCGGAFPVKDKNGAVIGTASLSAWKVGSFHVRSTCDGSRMSVEVARLATATTFHDDPLTKKPYAWEPLYKSGELGCESQFGTSVSSCPNPFCNVTKGIYKIVAGPVVPGASCNGGGWGLGMHYTGTVYCPTGYSAVGGGGACGSITGGGITGGSWVTQDGQGWVTDCCTYIDPAPAVHPGVAFVTCVKNEI